MVNNMPPIPESFWTDKPSWEGPRIGFRFFQDIPKTLVVVSRAVAPWSHRCEDPTQGQTEAAHEPSPLPGASTRDPTHDKVMRRKPDKQGRSGFQGSRKAALTLKISVFLMLALIDYSLISVAQAEGLPQSLFK